MRCGLYRLDFERLSPLLADLPRPASATIISEKPTVLTTAWSPVFSDESIFCLQLLNDEIIPLIMVEQLQTLVQSYHNIAFV